MAYGVRVVAFTTPTATGSQSITISSGAGASEQIKGAIVCLSGATSLDADNNDARWSVGMTDGTTTLVGACNARNNTAAGSANAGWRADREHIIDLPVAGSANRVGSATLTSLDVGGITINYDDAMDAAYRGYAILWYGSHMQCNVVSLAANGSTATTAPGWKPDGIVAMSVGHAFGRDADADNSGTECEFALGMSGRLPSITQVCNAICVEHNESPTSTGEIARNDRLLTRLTSTAGTVAEGATITLSSYDTSGFTVNASAAHTAAYFSFRVNATDAPKVYCEAVAQNTDTLAVINETSPSFVPMFALGLGTLGLTAATIVNTGSTRMTIGAATSSEQGYVGFFAQDNQATSNGKSWVTASRWAATPGSGGAYGYNATFNGFTSSGFDWEVIDAEGAGNDRLLPFMVIESIQPPFVQTETVQIADAPVLIHTTLQNTETVQISDQALLYKTVFDTTETVQVSDAPLLVQTSFDTSETVQVSDQALLYQTSFDTSETVQISDAHVFKTTEETADHVLVADETVQISDSVELYATLQSTETIYIEEQTHFVGTGTFGAFTESVEIADSALLYAGRVLVGDTESVQISDTANFGAGLVATRGGRGVRGTSAQGGAELGGTAQGGAKRGSTRQ